MQQIRRTPFVTHINLGHNPLGDFGLSIIVDYLHCEGRDLPIEELSLNNCDISDSGLGIISRYIWGNRTLRRLYLMGVSTGLRSLDSRFCCSNRRRER